MFSATFVGYNCINYLTIIPTHFNTGRDLIGIIAFLLFSLIFRFCLCLWSCAFVFLFVFLFVFFFVFLFVFLCLCFCISVVICICVLYGTRSFDQITFFRNSFFSFEFCSFEFFFLPFFQISVLSKKNRISKEIWTKNNPYKCTKIFVRIKFFQKTFFFRKLFLPDLANLTSGLSYPNWGFHPQTPAPIPTKSVLT